MRNEKLYNAFAILYKEIIKMLGEKLSKTPTTQKPFKIQKSIRIEKQGQASYHDSIELDLGIVFNISEKEIFKLQSAQIALNELRADETINRHLDHLVGVTGSGLLRIIAEDCLRRFFVPLLIELPNLAWNENVFGEHYDNFENAFYNEFIPYRAIAPLDNFVADFEEFPIVDGLRIIKTPKVELEQIWQRGDFNPFIDRNKIWLNEYSIEMFHQLKKVINGKNDKLVPIGMPFQEKIENILTTMRLYKSGMISFNFIEFKPIKPSALFMGIQSVGKPSTQLHPYFGNKYYLQASELEHFVELFLSFQNAKEHGIPNYLNVAIKRLEYAYERFLSEDKLLDYMIAFEAIFLKGDEQQELSYRMSLRIAFFLGETVEQRENIFHFMRRAYAARSKIVHGERASGEGTDKMFATTIEDHLRKSIKKVLSCGQYKHGHNVFIKTLDEKILV